MAYLGHKPAVGENNSFRILDDISSFVLTFDGSSASAVGLSDETITITENNHRFITGQRVTYSNGGGGNITGLTNGQAYFVINHSKTQIKLASSASNALAGTAVNLTGLGTGSSHTLTLAFDGVNTKFDPTFGNGMHDTLIKRAAQLVISINGVIQQPHDTATPTTGFGVDSLGHIIFSTAPASTDIFWGHILASNTVTFDSSDNDVDTFTGNGSTTSFTLSKIPPDNRNILVTIDGVVQYPSDAANTRSYNVSENVMTFVAAPGLGTVIQVRHIGYAGVGAGGGGGVTGFYGRTGNVSLQSTDNIVANNATFNGNVSIAQTLTYEDVTDIDSVGLITARSGINVSGGTLTVANDTDLNGNLDVAGISTLRGNVTIAGITTFSNVVTKFKANNGGNTHLQILSTGSGEAGIFFDAANGDISGSDYAFIGQQNNLDLVIKANPNAGNIDFQRGTDTKVRIDTSGRVGIGTDNPTKTLQVMGTILKTRSDSGIGLIYLQNDASHNGQIVVNNSGGTTRVKLDSAGVSYFNGGFVGIATLVPQSKLELDGRFRILDNSDGTPTSGKGLEISYYTSDDMADILSYDRGGGSYKKLQLRGSSIELKKNNTVLCNVGTGGNNATVGFSTTTCLVTNAEAIAVRGYSSFKSPSATYAAIYTKNELNGTGVLTPHILFNNNGANRGGFGYDTDNNTLIIGNHNDIMFKTGATQLGGTERLRIDSTGKLLVGIHTSSNYTWQPRHRFAVETQASGDASSIHFGQRVGGSADPAIMMLRRGGSTAWHHHVGRIYTNYYPSIYFQTSFATAPGSENFQTGMVIKHNVGVGIGTDDPKIKLHVHQNNSNAAFAHFTNTSTGYNSNQGLSIGIDSDENAAIYHYGSKNIRFATDNEQHMVLRSTGQLGIGTAFNPPADAKKLTVICDSVGDGIHIGNKENLYPAGSTGYSDIRFSFYDYLTGGYQAGGEAIIRGRSRNAYTNNRTTDLSFMTSSDDGDPSSGTATEKVRITTTGTIISNAGTFPASTSETLTIQGEGHNGHGTTNTRSVFNITGAVSSNSNAAGIWFGARTNQNTGVIGTRTSTGNLAFETYNGGWGERMRLTYNGCLNIGGSTQTNHMLYLQSTGDAGIHIRADSDNSGENDNPYLSMSQDGSSAQLFKLGMVGDAGNEFAQSIANASFIHSNTANVQPLQLAHMDNLAVTISAVASSHFHTYSGNTVAGVKIANRGNDTAAALLLQGHNNTGTPGQATNTQLTHLGANLEFEINHNGNRAIHVGSTRRIRVPGVWGVNGSSMRTVQIESDGNLCAPSSIREAKINIKSISDVSWLYDFNPVTFNFRTKTEVNGENVWGDEADDGGLQYGLIADEVEAVNQHLCFYDYGKLSGVHYDRMIAPLIKALQEQKAEIDALKARVTTLESS